MGLAAAAARTFSRRPGDGLNMVNPVEKIPKLLGKTNTYSAKTLSELKNGNTLEIGGKELEIERPASSEDFKSGRIFKDISGPVISKTKTWQSTATNKKFKKHLKDGEVEKPKPVEPFYAIKEDSVVLYDAKGKQYDENGVTFFFFVNFFF